MCERNNIRGPALSTADFLAPWYEVPDEWPEDAFFHATFAATRHSDTRPEQHTDPDERPHRGVQPRIPVVLYRPFGGDALRLLRLTTEGEPAGLKACTTTERTKFRTSGLVRRRVELA